jgi:hypothetical protein
MKYLLIIFSTLAFGQIEIKETFEDLSFVGVSGNFEYEAGSAATNVVGKEGISAIQFEHRADSEVRNEVAIKLQNAFEWGQEYWMRIWMNVVEPVSGFQSIMQFHAIPHSINGIPQWTTIAGTNGFGITTENANEITLHTATDSQFLNTTALGGAFEQMQKKSIPIPNGQWFLLVVHFNLNDTSDGFFEAWIDGNKIIDKHGTTVYRKDADGLDKTREDYLKLGVYHGPVSTSGILQLDGLEIVQGQSNYVRMAGAEPNVKFKHKTNSILVQ